MLRLRELAPTVLEVLSVSVMASWMMASVYLMAYVGWIPRIVGAFFPLLGTLVGGAILADVRESLAAGVISIVMSFSFIVFLLALPALLGQIADPELAGFFVDSIVIQVATASGPVPLHIITLSILSVVGAIAGGLATGAR